MDATWAVLLAGGRGTRFWPRSRAGMPKQCLALLDDRTLVQHTLDRLSGLIPPERTLVVTASDMAGVVAAQLPEVPAANVLVEPRGRNTAPSIAWAAAEVARRGGTAMLVLPSDHRIADEVAFRAVAREAVAATRRTGFLVLLGQQPDRAATEYGWLELGEDLGEGLLRVTRFVEKPARDEADALIRRGGHLWNGGMFAFTIDAIREAFAAALPGTAAVIDALVAGSPVEDVWDRTDATSIDYGVLERHPRIAALRCDFGWSDVGGWEALAALLPPHEAGTGRAAAVVALDAAGVVVDAPGKLVALLGVDDLVVVDTGDALLVCARDRAAEVPRLLQAMRARGLDDWT